MIFAAVALVGAACTIRVVPSVPAQVLPPTPAQVLLLPAHSTAQDARLTITGWVTVDGVRYDVSGWGVMRFDASPGMVAVTEVAHDGQSQRSELIATGGRSWTRVGDGEWDEKVDARASDPRRWPLATAAVMMPWTDDAWHVAAVSAAGHPFEVWVRRSDGYPLRFLLAENDYRLVIDFSDFNRRVLIDPPIGCGPRTNCASD
jgi:hypothetical protein